jgi:hypothetical protein
MEYGFTWSRSTLVLSPFCCPQERPKTQAKIQLVLVFYPHLLDEFYAVFPNRSLIVMLFITLSLVVFLPLAVTQQVFDVQVGPGSALVFSPDSIVSCWLS